MQDQNGSSPPVQAAATAKGPSITPTPIVETNFLFAQSCILLTAVELNLFTGIAQGIQTAEQLAAYAEADASALARLLGALCAMGFLQQTEQGYALTPLSERFLVRDREETYIGDVALQLRQEWDAWIHLTDVIRTGQAVRFINEEPLGGPFFRPLAKPLFPLIYPQMRRICERLALGTRFHGTQVLDLGAGVAPGAIAALEIDQEAHAVLVDFPEVLALAQTQAQKRDVASRLSYWPTNLETIELPDAIYDLVFASHVFRILGAAITQRLIHQCYRALKPGGHLVIVETYNNPEHSEHIFRHVVSLNMLVNTRHGDTFRLQQVRRWLEEAGFQVDIWSGIGPDPILIAERP